MFKILTTSLLITLFSLADGLVLKTGQTQSYNMDGNVVTNGSVKDDGFYQKGVARDYNRSEIGVVTDKVTGLQWQDDYSNNSDTIKKTDWQGAQDYCSSLEFDGGGWRLPARKELQGLSDYGMVDPASDLVFIKKISSYYWSSTTFVGDIDRAWGVNFSSGGHGRSSKSNIAYVRCIRLEHIEPSVLYHSGDMVTDSTTGLQWQDDIVVSTISRTWQEAINYCENTLNLGGYDDWRLPNINELTSILDDTQYTPAIDSSNNGFQNTALDGYRSSTTYMGSTDSAWCVSFNRGTQWTPPKSMTYSVRCVRDSSILSPILTIINLPYKEAVKPETFNLYIREISEFNRENLSATIDENAVSILETSTADGETGIKLSFEGAITNSGSHAVVLKYGEDEATITVTTTPLGNTEPFRVAKQSGGYKVSRGIASDPKFEIKVLDRSIISLNPQDASPFKRRASLEGSLSTRAAMEFLAYSETSAGLLLGASTGLEVDGTAGVGIGFSFPGFPLEGEMFKTQVSANGFVYLNTYVGRFYYPSDQYAIAASVLPAIISTIAPVGLTNVLAPEAFTKKIKHYGFDFQATFAAMNLASKPSFLGIESEVASISFSLLNVNGKIRAEWFKGEDNSQTIDLIRMQTETGFSAFGGNASIFRNGSLFDLGSQKAEEFEFGIDRDKYVFRSTHKLDAPIHYGAYPIDAPFVKRVDEYQLSYEAFKAMESQFGVLLDDNYVFTQPVLIKNWLRSDDTVKNYAFQVQVGKQTYGFSFVNSSYEDALLGVSYKKGDKSYIIYANTVSATLPSIIGQTSAYHEYASDVIGTAMKESAADLGREIKKKLLGAVKVVTETVEEGVKVGKDGATTVYKAWRDAPANIHYLWNTYTNNSQANGIYTDPVPEQSAINNANLTFRSDILDLNMSEGDVGGEVILYATFDPMTPTTGVYYYSFDDGQWIHIESQSEDGGLKFMATQGGYYALIDAFSTTEDIFESDLYSVSSSVTREIVSEPIMMSNGLLAINQEFNLTVTGSYSMVEGQLKIGLRPIIVPQTVISDENGKVTLSIEAGINAGRSTVTLTSYRGYTEDQFDLVVLDDTMTQPIENFAMAINAPLKTTVGNMIVAEANITQLHSDVNITIVAPNGASYNSNSVTVNMKGEWFVHLSAKDENGYEHTTSMKIIAELPTTTDFTINGNNDLLWHQENTGAVKVMEMNGLNVLEEITVVDASNSNLIPKGIGDFNGDGKPDILVHNQNTGMARAWIMDGTTRIENVALLDSSNTNLQIAGVGDFDADGDDDIATFNANSGALIIWEMDGTMKLRNRTVLTGANLNLVPRGAGDMDGDGIPDIVLRNNNSGAVRVWTMNSDFTRKGNEYVTGSSNTNLELRGVVDLNGDGNQDILNYNTNTGTLRAWMMDGNMSILSNETITQESDLDWSVRN